MAGRGGYYWDEVYSSGNGEATLLERRWEGGGYERQGLNINGIGNTSTDIWALPKAALPS